MNARANSLRHLMTEKKSRVIFNVHHREHGVSRLRSEDFPGDKLGVFMIQSLERDKLLLPQHGLIANAQLARFQVKFAIA